MLFLSGFGFRVQGLEFEIRSLGPAGIGCFVIDTLAGAAKRNPKQQRHEHGLWMHWLRGMVGLQYKTRESRNSLNKL